MSTQRVNLTFLLVVGTFFLMPSGLHSQKRSDTTRTIDGIFAELTSNSPGAAIRISRGNQVLYSKGFGLSDLEHRTAITDETIFEAGSVSKQFTATAVLMLARKGKLKLDDDVRKYIPELPDYGHTITVRHLIQHTSGLRDWGSVIALSGWPRGTRVYTNELALSYIIRQKALNYTPGAEYLYSNSNYTLLTVLAERVSGMSLPDFTEEFMFKPLGMKNTRWRNDFQQIVNNRAVGYDRRGGQFYSNMPFENTYGHAALLTTVKDLDLWNKSWKNSPLGGDSLLMLRTEQGLLTDGKMIRYAGGVMIDEHNGHTEVSHSGATAGYRAWLAYYPSDDLSVVFISNATFIAPVTIGKKIASIFFGQLPQQKSVVSRAATTTFKPNSASLQRLTGNYDSDECGGRYSISLVDDVLWLDDHVNPIKKLTPVAENRFEAGNSTYEFRTYGQSKELFVSVPRARRVLFLSR